MKHNYYLLLFICQLAISQMVFAQHENELIYESSPYLLQHANNPVDWYPWSEKALDKAQKEDKLLIISIGYAACHWCHVMEEETFEDTTVANFMNEYFVSIKVDREERPDIDQIYVDASRLITGNAGWPLNVIALPDGKPIYVVSYLPKDKWMKTLDIFSKGFSTERAKLEEQAAMITQGVKELAYIQEDPTEKNVNMEMLNSMFENMQSQFDFQNGGLSGSPKFPMPVTLSYLLEYYHATNDAAVLEFVTYSLDNIALGGLYDHLGGGFARYAVDEAWEVPHFEKMLYDNALLVKLYTNAYKLTGKALYKNVVNETLAFLLSEMRDSETGLFYSSLSADSEGDEGKFYTWTYKELVEVLGEPTPEFLAYFQITKEGNWEKGQNILRIASEQYIDQKIQRFNKEKQLLLKSRASRAYPEIDDKQLTSWNALMIEALANAYRTFGNTAYLKAAESNTAFLMQHFEKDKKLIRNYKEGKVISAFLDDYSYLINASITLYQATFNEVYLNYSKELESYTEKHFKDDKSDLYYYTPNDGKELVSRQMELRDNILPASNAIMCKNLQLLGWYFDEEKYQEQAESMMSHVMEDMLENGIHYASWASSALWIAEEPFEVAIVGENYKILTEKLDKEFHPNIVFFGGKNEGVLPFMQYKLIEGETNIYVCRKKICNRPVKELIQAKNMLK
ncbi:thioredoxin domain-containing protein [Chondrinema litorale]|uniref:thioredoxin domain-containing protein n=1 Tax=Chondrinema litorale TaxID=2994555 RepID=UPI0025436E44|nr:thioredoxin domain-containing protein [Chondrinema litorale]UZR99873.1 thioredoxin domain-containing protein [Chondrinema litorale]